MGLEPLAVHFLGDDLRAADLQLVALATHRLDEHGQLQFATAGHVDGIGRTGLEQFDRHVAEDLFVEAVDEVTAGEVLALSAGQRRGVHTERHAQHGLVDDEAGQGDGFLDRSDGVADLDLGEAGHDEQVACRQHLGLVAADAFERHELGEATLQRGLSLAELLLEEGDGLAATHDAVHDAADGEAAEVLAGVELGDHGLQWQRRVALRCRDGFEDGVEQGRQVGVGGRHADALHCPTLARHGRDDLEIDVLVVGVEVDEELVDLVEHFLGPGIAAVDLVDDHDGRQVARKRLLEHVPRLRQRALGRVDQQDDAVDHGERSLHFTAEIGVARGVDQVDLHALPDDGRRLGENGDATLALLVVRVHDTVDDGLMGSERAGGA